MRQDLDGHTGSQALRRRDGAGEQHGRRRRERQWTVGGGADA